MVTPDNIAHYLREKIECEHLAVDGDGAHFQAVIVAAAFEGKSRVQRHQLVYGALGDRMRKEIHALSMQTLTPAEWQASGAGAARASSASAPHHRH
jgi:acid stress-induced BolA-like protein IbaG/YrbA